MAEEEQKPSTISGAIRSADTQSFLGIGIVAAFVGVVVLVLFFPPAPEQAGMISTLIGGLAGLATMVGGYYFGSSKGSVQKDEASTKTMTALVDKVVSDGAAPPK